MIWIEEYPNKKTNGHASQHKFTCHVPVHSQKPKLRPAGDFVSPDFVAFQSYVLPIPPPPRHVP